MTSVEGSRRRVLVADDNAANRLVFSRMLTGLGCEVVLAGDGEEAVRIAGEDEVDVILMDCRMPVVDGYEAARRIRAAEGGRRVPIIALTAAVMAHDQQAARDAGMDDFLAKPVDIDAFRSTVERWLGGGASDAPVTS